MFVEHDIQTSDMLMERAAVFARNDYTDGFASDHVKAIIGRAEGASYAAYQHAYGVFGRAYNRPANGRQGYAYGVYGYANGVNATDNPGNHQYNYGVYGNGCGSYQGASGHVTNIGVYGTASSGDANWAGYFDGNVYSDGKLGLKSDPGEWTLLVNGTACKTQGGFSWTFPNDERLVSSQEAFDYGISEILKINPRRFQYSQDNDLNLNSETVQIAPPSEEITKVIPEAVVQDENGFQALKTDAVFWAMVNAIKELHAENERLKERILRLEIQTEQ